MKVEKTDEFKALLDTCRELSTKYIEISDHLSPDAAFAIKNLENNETLINFICSNFPFSVEDKIDLLQINNLKDRIYRLIQILNKEIQLAALKQSIQMYAGRTGPPAEGIFPPAADQKHPGRTGKQPGRRNRRIARQGKKQILEKGNCGKL